MDEELETVASDIEADAEELRAETPAPPDLEGVLRGDYEGLPPDLESVPFPYDTLTGPLAFSIEPSNEPQDLGSRFHAAVSPDGSDRTFVAYITKYRSLRGLAQYSRIHDIPQLIYDRTAEEQALGLWAHLIWPTVVAESLGGYHLVVNTYDRAHYTFGFYQLAAHTPKDNLILFFRKALTLPNAKFYFPDLSLVDGAVTQQTAQGPVSLEKEQQVQLQSGSVETQIPRFMKYLNPTTTRTETGEVLATAKLMHWFLNDPAALRAMVDTSFSIMRRKIKAASDRFNLAGKHPALAIWVSDIRHQGRGRSAAIEAALQRTGLENQLAALFDVDSSGQHLTRRQTVRKCVAKLMEEGRFEGVNFGEGALSLEAAPVA